MTGGMEYNLLDWATKNTNPEHSPEDLQQVQERIRKLDPEIVEMILGKDEAVVMRSCISRLGTETELEALEQLEMICESIDSAQNMGKMNLWPAVLERLEGDNGLAVMSLMGVAAQNNPPVQTDLFQLNVLPMMIEALDNSARAHKALHVISSMIQNNQTVFTAFLESEGFGAIRKAYECNERCKPRIEHLFEQLALQFPNHAEMFKL